MSTDATALEHTQWGCAAKSVREAAFLPDDKIRSQLRTLAMAFDMTASCRQREEEARARYRPKTLRAWLRDAFTPRGVQIRELERRCTWLEGEFRRLLDDVREARESAAPHRANAADTPAAEGTGVSAPPRRDQDRPGWPPHYGHPFPLTNPWEKE